MQNEKLKLKIILDAGAKVPTRAHEADAGLAIYAATDGSVEELGITERGNNGFGSSGK